MRSVCGLALCFLFSVAIAIGWATEPVAIINRGGSVTSRLANKIIWVRIELHPENRKLTVTCDSGDFYRLTEQQLEGERKPSEISFEFNLERGEYECTAVLHRNTDGKDKEFFAKTKFIIF